jgi:hypothetical protein
MLVGAALAFGSSGSLLLAADVAPAAASTRHDHAPAPRPRDVRVALVVDFGVDSGISPRVVVRCLHLAAGSNGTAVLAAAATQLRLPPPTYAPSGLLCSIDGYPTHGCGTPVGNGYAYWSYWHGGTHWGYAGVGPAEWTVTDRDVEGWRFEDPGAQGSGNVPPDAPTGYAAVCATASVRPDVGQGTGTSGVQLAVLASAGAVVVLLGAGTVRRWRRTAST